jgi:type I restriction enzyme, S subunit
LATEWRASTWGDEISLEYGKALRGHDTGSGRYRVFGSNGPIGWTAEPLAPGPGVILGRKGAYRGVRYSSEPFYVIDTAYFVVPKAELDMRWLYYAIQHHKLGEIDDGSPIPSTTRSAVYVQDLDVPPLPEQRAIAHILGTLDDKIELNRRMNDTMEATARALFKSWFVDFDPVRAKSKGRDPGLPPHLADLFPDSFEDSELGEIPKGWKVDSVYRTATVIYGAPFKSELFNNRKEGRPLVRIRDLVTQDPEVFTAESHRRGYLVKRGDLVVGMDGEFRAHLWFGPDAWLNQRLCCFKPAAGVPRAFVHYSIESLLDFFERSKTGTTVIHLGKADIDTFQMLVPPGPVLREFAAIVDPVDSRIVAGAEESRGLVAMRDMILPRLISGQLSVREAVRSLAVAQ